MATQANAATAKGATATPSNESLLRAKAPQLRTADAILAKNEQIMDAMERGSISPKMAEQMGQCCKMPIMLVRLEISYQRMIQGFGRKAPVPRSPLLRSFIPGLDPERVAPSDGEHVRALLGEK